LKFSLAFSICIPTPAKSSCFQQKIPNNGVAKCVPWQLR
jgi:hypothetical protein